jgi:hypothetical protein
VKISLTSLLVLCAALSTFSGCKKMFPSAQANENTAETMNTRSQSVWMQWCTKWDKGQVTDDEARTLTAMMDWGITNGSRGSECDKLDLVITKAEVVLLRAGLRDAKPLMAFVNAESINARASFFGDTSFLSRLPKLTDFITVSTVASGGIPAKCPPGFKENGPGRCFR